MIGNRMRTEPVPVVRQYRPINVKSITSGVPGKVVPVAAFGLLRGDSCAGRLKVGIDMAETHEVLFNRMKVRATSWFVPKVALDRFQKNVTFFRRSARGEPCTNDDGADVIPFIETMEHGEPGGHDVFKYLGLHAAEGAIVSTEYQEAYNQIVNYMRRNVSKALTERLLNDTSLAAAMWTDSVFSNIVADFDDGMIAGELPLTVMQGRMPVTGIGKVDGSFGPGSVARRETGGEARVFTGERMIDGDAANRQVYIEEDPDNPGYPAIFANFSDDGINVSLANIDQARKLVEWAKIRESYEGHSEPWIIDELMAGLEIDEQAWYYPMLLDKQVWTVEQLKRMATDGANLEEGVANGVAYGSLACNVPKNMYGGTIMVLLECVPEQLYERQADPYFTTVDWEQLPQYDRDVLNPVPVVEVLNGEIDVSHTTPASRFGYAERNWQWAKNPTRVGGSMFAPTADSATEIERRPLYPTDVEDPVLSEEFYLATTLGREVFVDQTTDPFKFAVVGTLDVMGLTVIGEVHESEANYAAVRAKYPPMAPIGNV